MKKILTILGCCILAHPLYAYADTQPNKDKPVIESEKKEESKHWSGYMTLISNYVFRGISSSSNLPAVQGSLTYAFDVGLYFNIWGSNVKFNDSGASVEFDTIIGWAGTFKDIGYDINYDRYNYPKASDLAYNELNLVLTYKFLLAGFSYSNNVYNSGGTGTYYLAGFNYTLPSEYVKLEDLSLKGTVGYSKLPAVAGNSYMDYSLALSKAISNYTLMLQWTGTNGKADQSPYDDNMLIFGVTASF